MRARELQQLEPAPGRERDGGRELVVRRDVERAHLVLRDHALERIDAEPIVVDGDADDLRARLAKRLPCGGVAELLDGDDVAGRMSARAMSASAIWLPRVTHTLDAVAASPRVLASIVASASRSRGCPSGFAYESSAPPRFPTARRYARPIRSPGASRTSERDGAKSSPPRGTSYGRSGLGAGSRSYATRVDIPAGDFCGANRRGLGSGSSFDTNVPRARCVTSHPSATRSSNAETTVRRCTPSASASVRVPGRGSPGRRRPRRMSDFDRARDLLEERNAALALERKDEFPAGHRADPRESSVRAGLARSSVTANHGSPVQEEYTRAAVCRRPHDARRVCERAVSRYSVPESSRSTRCPAARSAAIAVSSMSPCTST